MLKKKKKEDRKKEKAKRKKIKKSSQAPKKPKMTDQKAKLRRICNEYIRVRDCIKTTGTPDYCKCCSCNNIVPNDGEKLDSGHFIKSRHDTVTFDETNLHGQCRACNGFQGGKEAEYSGYIIRKYGLDKFEWLLAQKFMTRRWKAYELIELQHKFYDKLLKLLKDFPEYKIKSSKPTKLI